MDLQFYGANCLRLSTKKADIVIDDNLEKIGLKSVIKASDISLRSSKEIPEYKARFKIDTPGEYEISGVVIEGIAARAHMDKEGETNAIIYTASIDSLKVAFIGHIYPQLSEDQLDRIGLVDVAVIPVGGNGYTLDGVGALKIIKQVEPRIVIPSHYADKAINFVVSQKDLTDALKDMGMEPVEKVSKYKPNPADLTDTTHLVILERHN